MIAMRTVEAPSSGMGILQHYSLAGSKAVNQPILTAALLESEREGQNDRRKDTMMNFHESMRPDRVSSPVPLAFRSDALHDCAARYLPERRPFFLK